MRSKEEFKSFLEELNEILQYLNGNVEVFENPLESNTLLLSIANTCFKFMSQDIIEHTLLDEENHQFLKHINPIISKQFKFSDKYLHTTQNIHEIDVLMKNYDNFLNKSIDFIEKNKESELIEKKQLLENLKDELEKLGHSVNEFKNKKTEWFNSFSEMKSILNALKVKLNEKTELLNETIFSYNEESINQIENLEFKLNEIKEYINNDEKLSK